MNNESFKTKVDKARACNLIKTNDYTDEVTAPCNITIKNFGNNVALKMSVARFESVNDDKLRNSESENLTKVEDKSTITTDNYNLYVIKKNGKQNEIGCYIGKNYREQIGGHLFLPKLLTIENKSNYTYTYLISDEEFNSAELFIDGSVVVGGRKQKKTRKQRKNKLSKSRRIRKSKK
jgi:hypothetical protein